MKTEKTKRERSRSTKPSTEQIERLMNLAGQVWDLAPWAWMDEENVFGFRPSGSNETYFVSVLGALGEHFAMVVYCGADALHKFLDFHYVGGPSDPFELLEIPQKHVSFERRGELEAPDLAMLRKSDRKFAPHGHPLFRSSESGYLPHFIDAQDASIIERAMEHLLDVAPRVRESLALPDNEVDPNFLVRTFEDGKWVEKIEEIAVPDEPEFKLNLSENDIAELRSLPRTEDEVWEADFFIVPLFVDAGGGRRTIPRAILVADSDSGELLGTSLVGREDSSQHQFDRMAEEFVGIMRSIGRRPTEIRARSAEFLSFLEQLSPPLEIEIVEDPVLEMIDEARDSMEEYFSQPPE